MESFFSSNYRQYKKDTEYIAGWLAETAKKAGFEYTHPNGQAIEKKSHLIKVGDFVPMAEAIANHSPRISVPGALTKLFERVIQARKKAAAWISASRDKHQQPLEQSNQTHAHFIDILSNAAQILQPLVRERPRQAAGPGKRRKGSDLDSTREMTNAFSSLAVDGDNVPDDAGDEHETATRPEDPLDSLPPVNPVEVYQDESEIEAEFFFAIQSFLSNLHELRDIVQTTWWDYKNDRIDMAHASIIANTAIDLVRHAESEFELTLNRPKKYPSKRFPVRVLPALLLSTQHGDNLHGQGDLHDFLFPSGLMMPGAHDCSQVYWCFWPVYSGLKYYLNDIITCRTCKKPCIPTIQESAFEPVGGVHKDTMRTVKLCTTFRHFTKKHHDTIAIDEVTRGMDHMFKHNEVPLWTTFGMQLLLDIQDVIGEKDAHKPLWELQERLDREISYNELFAHKSSSPFSDSRTEELRGDMTHNLKYNQELAKDACDTLKPNPIRCGLLMYDAYLELNTTGHTLERVAGEMCMMAHLYKATRLIAPDSPKWPDMEFLIYQQDEDHLFFGGVPKTFEECVRKVKLMMGQSRADQAREERLSEKAKKAARGRPLKPKNSRWIQDPSILAPIFRERSFGTAANAASIDTQVRHLFNTLRSPTEQARLARKLRLTPEELAEKFASERLGRCEYHPGSDNGPTTLLRDLSSWLEGDATDLYFSWQALQDQCGKIWSRIVKSFSKDPKWDQNKSLTPYMGVCILEEAAADEHHWERIAKDDPKFAIHLRKVHIAIQATIFEKVQPPPSNLGIFAMEPQTTEHLARGGDVCLSRMATDSKFFFHSFSPFTFKQLYGNWPEDVVKDTKIMWAWSEHMSAVMVRCWGVVPGSLRRLGVDVYDPDEDRDQYHDHGRSRDRVYARYGPNFDGHSNTNSDADDDDHDHDHDHDHSHDHDHKNSGFDHDIARRVMEFNAAADRIFAQQ